MHRSLFILEFIASICKELGLGAQHGTLSAMARTCRFFERPALAVLWRSIPDLVPIFKCAGDDLWIVINDHYGSTLGLRRRISLSDVATMKRYGSFVRTLGELYLTDPVRPRIDLAAWRSLHEALGGALLFTKLRTLSIPAYLLMDNPPILTLLGSLALSNRHSLLAVYSVHGSAEVIKQLSHSPKLQIVKFDRFVLGTSERAPIRSIQSNIPTFPWLRCFIIGFEEILDAIQTIRCLPAFQNLEVLDIRIGNFRAYRARAVDWFALFSVIMKHRRVLRQLQIDGDLVVMDGENVEATVAPLNNPISVLSNFTSLTLINIKNMGGYNVLDRDLRRLTEALPRLAIFHLTRAAATSLSGPKTSVTFISYVYFARNCPFLYSLGLEIDAREDRLPSLPTTTLRGVRLRVLNTYFSLIDRPIEVTRMLFFLFPNLACFTHGKNRCKREGDSWIAIPNASDV